MHIFLWYSSVNHLNYTVRGNHPVCTSQWHISRIHFRLAKNNSWTETITKRYLRLTWVTWTSSLFRRRFYEKQWAVLPWPTAYFCNATQKKAVYTWVALCWPKKSGYTLMLCPDHKKTDTNIIETISEIVNHFLVE